jgi:hypothetical protein
MEWSAVVSGEFLSVGLSFLFFWTLIGQYVYREAKKEGRSSPKRRGLCWGILGVVGVVNYLRRGSNQAKRPAWLGFALLLFAFWAIEPVIQAEPAGWYAWAGFYSGLLVLYWQFDLETLDESGRGSGVK